jgi:response regulator of citrate/malate metabolism
MRKPRIIIFDDDVFIMDMLKRMFLMRDYEVFTYNNPTICPIYEKPVDSCLKIDPCSDIILTDLIMPRMNGIELLEYQYQRGCPVDIRNKAIISGATDKIDAILKTGYIYFKKPFKFSEISDWLKECEKRIDLSQPLSPL